MAEDEARDAAWAPAQLATLVPVFEALAGPFITAPVPALPAQQRGPAQQAQRGPPAQQAEQEQEAQVRALAFAGLEWMYALAPADVNASAPPMTPVRVAALAQRACRVALLLERSLSTTKDMAHFVATLLLGVFAADLTSSDRFGGRMVVWCADAWLAHYMKSDALVARLRQLPLARDKSGAKGEMRVALANVLKNVTKKANAMTKELLALTRKVSAWALAATILGSHG